MKEKAINFAWAKLVGANRKLREMMDQPYHNVSEETMDICIESAVNRVKMFEYIIKQLENGTD